MKLAGPEAQRFLTHPRAGTAAILLHGADANQVSEARRALALAIAGPEAETEMRLTRIAATDLRGGAGVLVDALRASGFFPGARLVIAEDATDAHAPALLGALEGWQDGDATLLITAGALAARSKLRAGLEKARNAVSIALYPDPPGRAEIGARLQKAGLGPIAPAALDDLVALGTELDRGDFAQMIERLSLYALGQDSPVTQADIAAIAPQAIEAELDDALNAMAAGQTAPMLVALRRLAGQGTPPTRIAIAAARHLRQLHAAAASGQPPEAALTALRPPVFGPRRATMLAALRLWSVAQLETAIALLTDTDLSLRSSRPAPGGALIERALVRVAMLVRPRSR